MGTGGHPNNLSALDGRAWLPVNHENNNENNNEKGK